MRVVADASVAVKWAVPDPRREEHLDQALALLDDVKAGKVVLLQPPHWMAEVAAVLTRLQPAIVEDALDLLDAMEIQVVTGSAVYKRASRMARALNKHLFDTLYHAVALECEGFLVTADGSYSRKARRLGSLIPLAAWKGAPAAWPQVPE